MKKLALVLVLIVISMNANAAETIKVFRGTGQYNNSDIYRGVAMVTRLASRWRLRKIGGARHHIGRSSHRPTRRARSAYQTKGQRIEAVQLRWAVSAEDQFNISPMDVEGSADPA